MKIAIVLSTHIDCNVRVDLLQSMIFSTTVAQFHAKNKYPDVETRMFVRLSCIPESKNAIQAAIDDETLPNLVIRPRQSQFQKIRSEVTDAAMETWGPQYYIFIDDDDMVGPIWLEQYIKYLKRIDEPLNPCRVIAECDYYYDASLDDTKCLMWKDVEKTVSGKTHPMDFSGICVSSDLVCEFLALFESEIDSGMGTVDRMFTNRIRRKARYHIKIPEPLVYYRQWNNPRSWKSNAAVE